MSLNPLFRRRASDRKGTEGQSESPRERRKRQRRKPGEFTREIEPMLLRVEPEVRAEIQALIDQGKLDQAKKDLMEYVVQQDRSEMVQDIIQKDVKPVERVMSWRVYVWSLIPVLILLYCIFSLLAKGRVQMP